MLKVLIVKTSSMGDIIHALPALTDAKNALHDVCFDWVIEPTFAEIPSWHKGVNKVIPCPLRKWRKSFWQCLKSGEGWHFVQALRQEHYDLIIDAQGLLKSALIAKLGRGKCVGPDSKSAREAFAAHFYNESFAVPNRCEAHAVVRMRQLFAKALGYTLPETPADYGISCDLSLSYGDNTVVFLHGTTWTTKHWPAFYWQKLAHLAGDRGYKVLLPWGNHEEKSRAKTIVDYCESKKSNLVPEILPKLTLREITSLISKARGIVAVDTGLGHMAAALAKPTVSLYGPTDPFLTGAYGPSQLHLKSTLQCSPCLGRECKQGQDFAINPPCFEELTPERVWETLIRKIENGIN